MSLKTNSSVVVKCEVGELVTISANTSVFNKNIPDNSLVYYENETRVFTIKTISTHLIQRVFDMNNYTFF